jgi:hypothetical protein
VETCKSLLYETLTPLADHLLTQGNLLRNSVIGLPLGGHQDDFGPGD